MRPKGTAAELEQPRRTAVALVGGVLQVEIALGVAVEDQEFVEVEAQDVLVGGRVGALAVEFALFDHPQEVQMTILWTARQHRRDTLTRMSNLLCGQQARLALLPAGPQPLRQAGKQLPWLLEVESGQWRNAGAENNPNMGMSAAMCYDARRGRMLVFGGPGCGAKRCGDPGRQLWRYTIDSNAWTGLPDVPHASPAPGLAYDSKRAAVVAQGSNRVMRSYFPEENEGRVLAPPDRNAGPKAFWHTLAYDSGRA